MAIVEIYEQTITFGGYTIPLSAFSPSTLPSGQGKPVRMQSNQGVLEGKVSPMVRFTVEIPGDKSPMPMFDGALCPEYLVDPNDPDRQVTANEILIRLIKGAEGYRMTKPPEQV